MITITITKSATTTKIITISLIIISMTMITTITNYPSSTPHASEEKTRVRL